ncbi:MAG: ATP synthase F0 subunit A [Bacteroidetes bacterium]|nr:MAG: ATP synthase F0 subunit A [Bacteroidota bacterium]
MVKRPIKLIYIVAFSCFLATFGSPILAQDHGNAAEHNAHGEHAATPKKMDPGKVLMEHILDNHEYHIADYNGHAISLPLPIILYSSQRGFAVFSSKNFEHGHAAYKGYRLIKDEVNGHETIVAVQDDGVTIDEHVKVLDLSLTRNVTQMLLALTLLVVLMINVAKKYRGGLKAPSGFQNAVEPVITFVRDEVAKPNLGHKYQKYMPYLLTVFFFILINNLVGLIPGSANVTGNIAVTLVLGVISLKVILFSTNKHFWGHIFNPPNVPLLVKFILVPVEFLGIFIKPIALIIRLFANMVAGHMIIVCLILMIFIFAQLAPAAGIGFSPVSIAFTVFIYCIELLVAFIQAFIFTNLTAVFIGLSMEGDHGHEEAATHH